ncbi:MAG: prolyl oligopeptidase family serine peptidase [Opitutaceae bacterium]|nr:prolyl oligopeptidase family serine peptidase [Opitutaceae bacterium]
MKTMIGAYGPWVESMLPKGPGRLSLQQCPAGQFAARREQAKARVTALIAPPEINVPQAQCLRQWEFDGLAIEEIAWSQPAGGPTLAWVLKPVHATGRLPGVLALHDHGRFKFFGKEKIAQTGAVVHPRVAQHRADAYEGLAWANELAKRGYVVMVHDAFAFGSRRVRLADVPEDIHWGLRDDADESTAGIAAYDDWAAEHEHVMAKSLFSAGTTWPGVFFAEDRVALDVLCARDDVDANRIGAGGLSGGGLRTNFLAGLDERVKCAVSVGMMTTWRDFLLNKSFTHTWMCYVPLLPRDLDFSEIIGLRAPLPALVQNTRADPLFTLEGMEEAAAILQRVYAAAGATNNFRASWYPGHHQFNRAMQAEAFAWFAQWL